MKWILLTKWAIAILGGLSSLFYGLFSVQIFWFPKTTETENRIMRFIRTHITNEALGSGEPPLQTGGRFTIPPLLHQFWLNLVGSAIGWMLIFITFSNLTSDSKVSWSNVLDKIALRHIVAIIIGTIGIVGWLPMTLVGIVRSLAGLLEAALGSIKKRID